MWWPIKYRWRVLRQALSDTRGFFGWNLRTAISAPFLYATGLLFLLWLRGIDAVINNIGEFFAVAFLPAIGYGVLVVLFNLFMAPARLHREQEAMITDLRQQLSAFQQRPETGLAHLAKMLRTGGDLFKRHISKGDFKLWEREFKSWIQEVDRTIADNFPESDAELFQHDVTMPWNGKTFPQGVNSDHHDRLNALTMYLNCLRQFIEKQSSKQSQKGIV